MRVAHLTDDELQVYLDRWTPRGEKLRRETPSLEDIELYQHIEHCSHCQEELALYRALYHDLAGPAETQLPRSFARKATWSLPPFAAMRTRARLKAGLSSGLVGLLVMAWLFTRIEWTMLMAKSLVWVGLKLEALSLWAGLLWGLVPHPAVAFPDLSAEWLRLYDSVAQAFTFEPGMIHFAIIALAVAVLVGSSDRILMRIPNRFRLW